MRTVFNTLGNIFMKPILRSPLHFLVSGMFMLITFTGRKSGKVYTTPVQYKREGNVIFFVTMRGRVWWHNLRDDATVTVRVRGEDLTGTAEVVEDVAAIAEAMPKVYPISAEKAAEDAPLRVLARIHLQ